MIELTEIAAKKIIEIAKNENIASPVLRVALKGGGCHGFSPDLYFDDKPVAATDQLFDTNGVKVVVDQMSLMYLAGVTIDYVDGLMGTGFKFNGGQITGKCGCGQSISFE